MFLITWVFDKLGYMPKFFTDVNLTFPTVQNSYIFLNKGN